jgi:SNF2 family DNA or RNA helicase
MLCTPRVFQARAFAFMWETPKCALLASMGMGKTMSTLMLLTALDLIDGSEHTLVMAPKRVTKMTWPDEIKEWDDFRHLDYSVITGTAEQRRRAMRADRAIHLINYENIPWLLDEVQNAWPWPRVIADESSKLKSHSALRFKGRAAQREIRDKDTREIIQEASPARRGLKHVAHRSKRWINLTGTPSPNGLMNLWSQMYLLDSGARLGRNITAFRDRWFYLDREGHSYIPLPGALEQIMGLIEDICLTLDSKDYFDLPPLVINNLYVELPTEARRHYRELERDYVTHIQGHRIDVANAAVLSGKLLQAASGAIYTERGNKHSWVGLHDEKLDALEEVLDEAMGNPVMIAYNFDSDLQRLRAAHPDARLMDSDPQTLLDWNDGRIAKLLIHPASAGHGLNMQFGGNILVFFSLTWNLEDYQQIIERIGPTRQAQSGLNRPTFVHHILARNTIDEYALERLAGKATLQDAVKNFVKRLLEVF